MPIRYTFLALMFLAASHLYSQTLQAAYARYQKATGKEKVAAANSFFATAKKAHVADTLYKVKRQYADSTTEFLVNYLLLVDYYNRQQFNKACYHGERAISYYNRRVRADDHAACLSTLASACLRQGDIGEALHYQLQCYDIDLRQGDKANISSSLNNLAAVYIVAQQPQEAVPLIERAIAIERELGNRDRLAVRLGKASEVYVQMHQTAQALQAAKEAYQLDKEDGRKQTEAIRAIQLATVYVEMQSYAQAQRYINEALPQLKADNNRTSMAIAYHLQGKVAACQGKTKQAETCYHTAISLARQTGNRYVEKNSYHSLYLLYRTTDPAKALALLERYVYVNDSIYNDEVLQMQKQSLTHYHTSQLQADNRSLNETNAQQLRVNTWLKALMLALIMGMIVGVWRGISLIRKRTKHIKTMREQTVARMHFFTNLTHEFRTPLTVINGMSQQIADGKLYSDDELHQAATAINRQGQRLERLTNQILDIGKIQAALAQPHFFHDDILPQLAMIVESFMPYARTQKVNLHYEHPDESLIVDFDPDYLRKVVANLIGNALKFTPRDGTITLAIVPKGTQQLSISVADTGIGIAPDVLPHVFDIFYQGHTDSKTIGTGIGLSLVKEIVEVMHGTVSVESEVDKGTTFTILLPRSQGKETYPKLGGKDTLPIIPVYRSANGMQPVDTDIDDEPTDTELPTLLVVEDNADVSTYIRTLLQYEYNLLFAADGEEGLQKAQQAIPDLIITDLMMPKLSGEQLLHTIRTTEAISHIPVVVITAKTEHSQRIGALAEGADAYLVKPFSAEELRVRVQQLIQQRRNLRKTFAYALQHGTEKEIRLNDTDRTFLSRLHDSVVRMMREGSISVDQVALEMCMSKRQLLRKVQALTGETTVAYILHLRLRHARRLLLEHPSVTVGEVAAMCGFEDAANFSRKFKQMFQLTPTELRNGTK